MFKKIFQYFRNNKEEDGSNVLAEVCIRVCKDEDKPSIDILIDDYNEHCVQGLATIIQSIENKVCSMEIIKMVTKNLQENQQAEALVSFLIQLGTSAQIHSMETQSHIAKEGTEEPCIKPSDMIQ